MSGIKNNLARLYLPSLAFYFSLLVVATHESTKPLSWSMHLRTLYVAYRYPNMGMVMDDSRAYFAAFFLVWMSATLVFVCLLILERSSSGRMSLRVSGAAVAIAGLPVASLYSGEGRMPFLEVELFFALIFLTLWAYRKWLVSTPLNIVLLVLHFALWAEFSKFLGFTCCIMLWPGWTLRWGGNYGETVRFIYPILGFCFALLWATYFRQPGITEQVRQPMSLTVK